MVFPAFHLTSFYFQLDAQLDKYFDPYTGKRLEPEDQAHFRSFKISLLFGVIILFLGDTWHRQRELIKLVLNNHMLKRQQT